MCPEVRQHSHATWQRLPDNCPTAGPSGCLPSVAARRQAVENPLRLGDVAACNRLYKNKCEWCLICGPSSQWKLGEVTTALALPLFWCSDQCPLCTSKALCKSRL